MSATIEVSDLPARLNEALAIVALGGEVLLTDGAKPRARIVAFTPSAPTPVRVAGLHANAIQTTPDFDASLPDDFWAGQS